MSNLPYSIDTDFFTAYARTIWGFFVAVLVGSILLLMALDALGLPQAVIGMGCLAGSLIAFVGIGLASGSTQAKGFFLAGGSVPAGYNGMAAAAAYLSTAWFLLLGAAFSSWGAAAWAIVAGALIGLAAGGHYLAAPMRQSGATSTADFLARRLASPSVRLAASLIVIATGFMLLAVIFNTGGRITENLLGLPFGWGVGTMAAIVALMLILGGMRSTTWTQTAQFIVMFAAFLLPVAIAAADRYGWPLPQLALRDAASAVRTIAGADPRAAPAAAGLSLFGHFWPADFAGLLAFTALCSVALPHVLERYLTAPSAASARRSSRWLLLFTGLFLITAPTYAAFSLLELLRDVVGMPLQSLPDWVFSHGQAGSLALCGAPAVSPEAIRAACGARVDTIGLSLPDIRLASETMVISFAEREGLSFAFSSLIFAGTVAAALSSASGLLMVIVGTASQDIQHRLLMPDMPIGKRLLAARLTMLGAIALAATWALEPNRAVIDLGFLALGLIAAGLMPVLIATARARHVRPLPALLSMLAGTATLLALFMLQRFGFDLRAASGDEWQPQAFAALSEAGIPLVASTFIAIAASTATLILASVLVPATALAARRGRGPKAQVVQPEELYRPGAERMSQLPK
ncbi:sodium:solute symporter family transporter [Afifella sp. YEN Y35]|uniref:sodium:solute symporter family transporter n=1 Tax=Afifella sp. YEN Y35 TaxID=3388337 RepID=UPI0039DF7022